MTPYPATPTKAHDFARSTSIVESGEGRVEQGGDDRNWCHAGNARNSTHNAGDTSPFPPALQVAQTYLILSEVSYLYTPTIGYVMAKAGVTLSDVAYTRPRQSTCVIYNTPSRATTCPTP